VTYRLEGSDRALLLVNGQLVPAPAEGTAVVTLPCDGAAHTLVLVAYDAASGQTTERREVSTQPQGA
jgi:hypothetical protein